MTESDSDDVGPAGRLRNWLKLKRKDRKREEALRDVIEEIIEEAEAEGESPVNEEPITAGERGLLRNIGCEDNADAASEGRDQNCPRSEKIRPSIGSPASGRRLPVKIPGIGKRASTLATSMRGAVR